MSPILWRACPRCLPGIRVVSFSVLLLLSIGWVDTRLGAQPAPVQGRRGNSSDTWNSPVADSLVSRAIARRGIQLADSTLLSYRADAHGFLAFLAQLGEGAVIPPKVVQSEELALSVSWWQPGRSAQQLVGRRDTTLLPADVGYYRDRYGVVLDNLPDRIRLGDGQDVRDVPHPLAAGAQVFYEYAMGDSLRIGLTGRDILVDEVRFRPRNAAEAAAVGSVYLDRETAAVVRLSMTFTRAALIDRRIETLVLTLENGLVYERYWLPRRQEIEVSRGSTWFDIPVRGIVRGRWEISGYSVNERISASTMLLPRWSSLPQDSLGSYEFDGRMVDVMPPEIRMASSEDVVRARVQAEAAVRAAMLTRPTTASVSGRGISDIARFNRVEGLALGIGGTHRTARGVQFDARLRYGFSDHALKGYLSIGRAPAFGRTPTLRLFVERDIRDPGFAERAGVTNSLASLLFGSDLTVPVETRAAGVLWRRTPTSAFTWRLAAERDRPTRVTARPLSHSFAPTLAAWPLDGVRAEVTGSGGWVSGRAGTSGLWTVGASAGWYLYGGIGGVWPDSGGAELSGGSMIPLVVRTQGMLQLSRPIGTRGTLSLLTFGGGAVGRHLPPQWLVFAGGPWTAPGYDARAFGVRALLSQRVELRTMIPAPSIPLGRFGSSPGHITLAPFVQALATSSGISEMPATPGVHPSAGLGILLFYDLLRVDVARGLRRGSLRFAIDIDRGFWGML